MPADPGQVVKYVAAGPVVLGTATWDVATGGSGGLVPGQLYYLSQTKPGQLTTQYPFSGAAVKIGIALNPTTLNVQIEFGQTDGLTLIKRPPGTGAYSAVAYGFASGLDLSARSNESWQLAPAATLPGTPVYKNLVGGINLTGQQLAVADTWLSSHVLGLTTAIPPMTPPLAPSPMKLESFISGGLFELTEVQWNAVWTAADPDRGGGSGLLPGYPYYLSDIPGTFFLIDKTGTPPVASGNWLTKCFVALSSTTVLIQISDPRKISTVEESHTEDTSTTTLPLPLNTSTEVLSCPAIEPGAGNIVQITGAIGVQLVNNPTNTDVLAIVVLLEDDNEIARFSTSLAPNNADIGYKFFGSIPIAWTFAATAGSHVYSVNVVTDMTSTGVWTAQDRAVFVDVLAP